MIERSAAELQPLDCSEAQSSGKSECRNRDQFMWQMANGRGMWIWRDRSASLGFRCKAQSGIVMPLLICSKA
ncbi:MAG: hypothetical protein IKY83_00630 [Proteobacteria bacterium]|nr:hypothetical protein [Pseudomonadota bacterium]